MIRWAGNVCEVGTRYFGRLRELGASAPAMLDPRRLYHLEHHKMLKMLKREHGGGLRHVAGIDMEEARNFGNFVDKNSVRGLSQAASFAMGCLLGGRRPRTLTSVRLRDCQMYADEVVVDGQRVLVPGIRINFVDEKVDDIQGPRFQVDRHTHKSDYAGWHLRSPAFFLYRLLVVRGAFQEWDPICQAKAGSCMAFSQQALDWYLLCHCTAEQWIDTCPVSVAILGYWTKAILRQMGRPERGFSAHRRGGVTRGCILMLLQSYGKELPKSKLQALVRWGGWTGHTGILTVLRTYAGKVMDAFFDVYGIAYGRETDVREWEAKLEEYCGQPMFPAAPIKDHGCRPLHIQVKVAMHRLPVWQSYQQLLNSLVSTILRAASLDPSLRPINRYQEDRRLLNVAVKKYEGQQHVEAYAEARRQGYTTLAACCDAMERACVHAFMQSRHRQQALSWSVSLRRLEYTWYLVDWEPGMVMWAGSVQPWRLTPCMFLFGSDRRCHE